MDARYESAESVLLNRLIDLVNKNIQENVDDFLTDNNLCQDVKLICSHIYDYAKMRIDLDVLFSKQNFLAINIVLLPNIQYLVFVIQEKSTPHQFSDILYEIKSVMVKRRKEENGNHDIYKDIQKILFRYDLDQAIH